MTATAPARLLTREDILGADDRATEDVDVPEWGGTVRIKALSGAERERYLGSMYTIKSNGQGGMEIGDIRIEGSSIRLVALSVVDEDGARLFTEADVAALGERSAAALDRVYQASSKLSRLGQTLEQVKADLGVAQNGSSGSV